MKFIVENMSCQHCVKTVTNIIHHLDQNAKVSIDLSKKELLVDNTSLTHEKIINALEDDGYPAILN